MLANEPQVEPNLVTMQVMVMVGMRLKHAHYPVYPAVCLPHPFKSQWQICSTLYSKLSAFFASKLRVSSQNTENAYIPTQKVDSALKLSSNC